MKKYFFITMSILIMVIIFIFSSENGAESVSRSDIISETVRRVLLKNMNRREVSTLVRKAAHFIVYFFLATFLQMNFSDKCRKRKNKFIVLSLVFLYACTDEYHQSFVSGRGSHFTDVLIDTAGGITSIFMVELWRRAHKIIYRIIDIKNL